MAIKGLWDTTKTGIGAFSFDSMYGHIGTFWFGPNPITVTIGESPTAWTSNSPTVFGKISYGNTFNVPASLAIWMSHSPDVYAVKELEIDFVGVPRVGTSPLTVDFKAIIRFTGSQGYVVDKYRWYYDAGNNPTAYEETTTPNYTHVYNGYRSQKFDVKLCVSLGRSN